MYISISNSEALSGIFGETIVQPGDEKAPPTQAAFAVKITDFSMADRFLPGDEAICFPCDYPIVGKLYAFEHKSRRTRDHRGRSLPLTVIRRYQFESAQFSLQARDPNQSIQKLDDWCLAGVVVGHKRIYAPCWETMEVNLKGLPWDKP